MFLTYTFAVLSWTCAVLAAPATKSVELLMPEVQPKTPDTYLCRSIDANNIPPYITGFVPTANMDIAHHILLYGCTVPGSDAEVWNCGEMAAQSSEYKMAPVCSSGSKILYAWAMDAPPLKLPKDVAFKVGEDTGINKLTLQVHYKNVSSFLPPANGKDSSGLTLQTTDKPRARRAAVYLMGTGGKIPSHSVEYLEVACPFPDAGLEIHPFAFRTHAHKLGRVVAGYRIRDGQWTEIGRKDPRKPEMFYNVTNPGMTLKKGDIMAARCTFQNDLDQDVAIGATQKDEMCNFYIMYFVDGDRTLSQDSCWSSGGPTWYLENYPDQKALNLKAMPDTASTLPETGEKLEASTETKQEAGLSEDESAEDEFLDNLIAKMDPRDVADLMDEVMWEPKERDTLAYMHPELYEYPNDAL